MKQTPIDLARKHVGNGAAMDSSARLCLSEAIERRDKGELRMAELRALDSLAYSVGILHADYCRAWRHVFGKHRPAGVVKTSDRWDAIHLDTELAA